MEGLDVVRGCASVYASAMAARVGWQSRGNNTHHLPFAAAAAAGLDSLPQGAVHDASIL